MTKFNPQEMKAQFILQNAQSENAGKVILRNLSRIMNIRVLNFEPESKRLTLLYLDAKGLRNILQELRRIGFPVQNSKYTEFRDGNESLVAF